MAELAKAAAAHANKTANATSNSSAGALYNTTIFSHQEKSEAAKLDEEMMDLRSKDI